MKEILVNHLTTNTVVLKANLVVMLKIYLYMLTSISVVAAFLNLKNLMVI